MSHRYFTWIFLIVKLSLCLYSTASFAEPVLVEPDKPYAKVHNWRISTARFGVGCIAVYPYGPKNSWTEISVGGDKWDNLSLIIITETEKLGGNLELVLDDQRWGELSPYGYRGTPGVVVSADKEVLAKLKIAPSLKLTDRGFLKLRVPLRDTSEALEKLAECFKRTR